MHVRKAEAQLYLKTTRPLGHSLTALGRGDRLVEQARMQKWSEIMMAKAGKGRSAEAISCNNYNNHTGRSINL